MRILVIGAGGTGGYFGGRWAEAGHDVTLLARGAHLEAIRAHGLMLLTPGGDVRAAVRATADPASVGPVDLVLVATRTWQLEDAVRPFAPLLARGTPVLGVQNGVESPAMLAACLPQAHVLGGTCRIMAFIEGPGVIRHGGIAPVITLGELTGGTSPLVDQLVRELDLGDRLRMIASDDIVRELWRKFLFFAPASGMGSITRSPIGEWRAVPESRAIAEAAMREVLAVARARGVALPDDALPATLAFVDAAPPTVTSSMQRDFDAGRRTELEALAGAVHRMGRVAGVPTPVHDLFYCALLPMELRARQGTA